MIPFLLLAIGAQAHDITVVTDPWHLTTVDAPEFGYNNLKDTSDIFNLGFCLDPDECPYARQSGEAGTVIAYDSNGSVVDFERWDGEPFMKCYQKYDSVDDTHQYGLVYERAWDSTNGEMFHPGKNGSDGWPYKVSCYGSENGDTVQTETLLKPAPQSNIAKTTINLTTGYSVTLDEVANQQQCWMIVTQKLPSGTYVDGRVNGKQSGGSTWTGVFAYIKENGANDYIAYRIGCGATEGSGYFTISRNGSPVNTPFSFDRE